MKFSARKEKSSRKGFTIMELIIVIALLAGIIGLVVSNFENVLGTNEAKIADIYVNSSIKTPLLSYRTTVGRYPTTEQGLKALVSPPAGVGSSWKGPYVEEDDFIDPWKNEYQYRYPGVKNKGSYDIWSFGPDGVESADDIGNW